MIAGWRRRARAPISAVLACALAPFLATASDPATTAALGQPDGDAAGLDGVAALPVEDDLRSFAVVPATLSAPDGLTVRARDLRDSVQGAVSPKGRLWSVSELSDHGLPVAAERAYRRAADQMARTDPACRLPWTLLAAVGRIESDHGRHGGARLGDDGVSRPRIIGVRLDGTGPVAAIRDTDDGRLDRDRVWDRAVGPMQFIPSTWASAARDGDGDGRRSPHDLDDAAAAAASYLCSGSGTLVDPSTQAAAIFRYNQDDYYVALVQAFEVGYRTGSFVIPPPPPPDEELAERRQARRPTRMEALREERREDRRERREERRRRAAARPAPAQVVPAGEGPPPKPAPAAPPKPKPKPKPSPSTEPSPSTPPEPKPYDKTGPMTPCGGGYCLDGALLDLGAVAAAGETADGDYDLDGTVETNGDEVAGLLDLGAVTMTVVDLEDGRLGIYSINAKPVSE